MDSVSNYQILDLGGVGPLDACLKFLVHNAELNSRKMIKLFKVKEKQREIAENNNGNTPVKKQSAGELRLHKGFIS